MCGTPVRSAVPPRKRDSPLFCDEHDEEDLRFKAIQEAKERRARMESERLAGVQREEWDTDA